MNTATKKTVAFRVFVIILAILALGFIAGQVQKAFAVSANTPKKYFVCKYVGTPGLNEKLQTGNNPISVSENALTPPIVVGGYFNDAQGRSFVVAEDTGQSDPSCATPQNNPCQYDATLLATDPKCVAPTPTPTPDPVVTQTPHNVATDEPTEVFVGK